MNLSMTQKQIASLLEALPADHPERATLAPLVRESRTLRVLHEVGLATSATPQARERFATWPGSDAVVYPSEADAREACPRAFKEVCSQWGRAGNISRDYPLADGRVITCRGIWWDVPEPGGSTKVFFFA